MIDRYTSGDVARIAGVSLRQLQWWDERNVVSPRQEGHRRVYLPREVVKVSVIAELRRKGLSLKKIRRAITPAGQCKSLPEILMMWMNSKTSVNVGSNS